MSTRVAAAAAARAAGVAAQADRPRQRRCGEERFSCRTPSFKMMRAEFTGLGETGKLTFRGMASVTEVPYEMYDWYGPYDEVIHIGAFGATLATDGLDVPLVVSHDTGRRLARTISSKSPLVLEEITSGDVTGLEVYASDLPRDIPDVALMARMHELELIDEMSFKFSITSGRWNDRYDEYHIYAVDIHRGDVSIVGYGANPSTSFTFDERESAVRPAAGAADGRVREDGNRRLQLLCDMVSSE